MPATVAVDCDSSAIGRELAFCAPCTVTPAGMLRDANVNTAISSRATLPPEGEKNTPAIGVVMPGPLKLGAALFLLVLIVYVPLAKGEPPSDVNSSGLSG